MNAMRCRYESEMIRALKTGALSESLIEHQKSCSICREVAVVAQALLRDADDLAARHTPPLPSQILVAAERRRRMAALERATRFVFALKIAGLVYAAVLALWGLHALAVRGVLLPGLNTASLNATMAGAGLAVLFVSGGLWYALRRDERLIG
jgi:predicted anti-sigma-YlaC factor YlaD